MDPDIAHTPWHIDRFATELEKAIRNKDSKAHQNDRPQFLVTLSRFILLARILRERSESARERGFLGATWA